MQTQPKIRTCIWYETGALEAVRLYTSLFPGSSIEDEERYDNLQTGEEAGVRIISFTLVGAPFTAMQAGPHQQHNDMMSISVITEDQAETDRLWNALREGGRENPCGWLKDRWGISWQIAPRRFAELMEKGNKAQCSAVMQALMQMKRIDIAALEAAYGAA